MDERDVAGEAGINLCKALQAMVRFLSLSEGQHGKPVDTPVGFPPSVFGDSTAALVGLDT